MRRFVLCFVMAVLTVTIAACGNDTDPDPSTRAGEEMTSSRASSQASLQRPVSEPKPLPDTVTGFSYFIDERLPEDVRGSVYENRSRLFVNTDTDILENPGKYMALDYDEAVDDWLVETLENSDDTPFMLTYPYETIEEELDFLMTYLKYAYGAYQYYGGDDVFLPLKAVILDRLKQVNTEEIRYSDYSYILHEELIAVIIDCHFAVGDKYFSSTQRHGYFIRNSDYAFTKSGDAFYIDLDAVTYELISVDGIAPADKLIPYLDGSGHVVWIMGYPSTSATEQSCSIILYHEASGEIREEEILVTGVASTMRFENVMYMLAAVIKCPKVAFKKCTDMASRNVQ